MRSCDAKTSSYLNTCRYKIPKLLLYLSQEDFEKKHHFKLDEILRNFYLEQSL